MLVNAYMNKKLTENVCRLAVADKKIDALSQEHPQNDSERCIANAIISV